LCNHLALGAENVLHIGDHPGEDWEGARNAGLEALLLRRGAEADDGPPRTITDLGQVPEFLGVA
jgi:FMN phosphatase YigB (HAD superfamily)